MDHNHRPLTRRPPLGEATRRVNNAQHEPPLLPSKASPVRQHDKKSDVPQVKSYRPPSPPPHNDYDSLQGYRPSGSLRPNPANPRLSAISREHDTTSKRDSLISTTSTDSNRVKVYIGPWRLGKTLGEGATARVRLAKHASTGQKAAVKIVQKRHAQMSQAGSLADLDQVESSRPDNGDGLRRMPVGIEREVAIMKLIQHPNIMKLYDIWENRTEIYLVLEYVNNGELFDYISSRRTGLKEEEALKFFRQILSAVGYCHSFNICHRDLKPENILLTKELEIKIADFGMAALHQSPDHKLQTSCGSPHYAAPEVVRGAAYRGNQVDIWSMGVILYAALSGRLPFDMGFDAPREAVMPALLAKIKLGRYEIPSEFSGEAKDLVRRMLQVNPHKRITLREIWRHPLLRKYDYLDNLASGSLPQSPGAKNCGRPVLRRSDIDKELLRHLRSMWHGMSEQQITEALLSEIPNDQKLFYTLLLKYRDTQLENYAPDLGYSNSDYHHVRPLTLKKTYSTCQFPQAKTKGHGRQVSKFTVVSNAAETERSYDPFKASRPQHLNGFRNDYHAKITIHRPDAQRVGASASRYRSASGTSSMTADRNRLLLPHPRSYASRSSLASSTRSRNSNPYVRATIGHKRGVSFSHLRKDSFGSQLSVEGESLATAPRHSNNTEVTDCGGDTLRPVVDTPASTRYIRSRKAHSTSQPLLSVAKRGRTSQIWNEDVRQLSTSLAKDCDEAFNRTSVISDISEKSEGIGSNGSNQKTKRTSLSTRPLPPPPTRTESVKNELLEARKQAELRKLYGDGDESPSYLERMVSHIDRLMQPVSPTHSTADRRSSSAPVETKKSTAGRLLPSIDESHEKDISPRRAKELAMYHDRQRRIEAKTGRIASAPEPRDAKRDSFQDRFARANSLSRDTIRMVDPTSPESPVKPPAPLTIRKKSSQGAPPPLMSGGPSKDKDTQSHKRRPSGLDLRQQYDAGRKAEASPALPKIEEAEKYEDGFENESTASTIVRKTSGWFKRSSKSGEDFRVSIIGSESLRSHSSHGTVKDPYTGPPNQQLDSAALPNLPKKKPFSLGRWFKKRNSKPDMTLGADDTFDDDTSVQDSIMERHYPHLGDPRVRQIAPQQNWLAKLFNVKPASRYLCFCVSKRRARQEIGRVLKEWKRYGLEDVQVDKDRNIVFGRVALGNYFSLKEVSFAGEILTVIEHGKRSKLSIARFTQERGAASSFQKVLETMETVLKSRGLLLTDQRKKRMMIKTLNAA